MCSGLAIWHALTVLVWCPAVLRERAHWEVTPTRVDSLVMVGEESVIVRLGPVGLPGAMSVGIPIVTFHIVLLLRLAPMPSSTEG